MNSTIASALVIVIELILRGACVFAILRVTLTLFKIDKAEKAEKERDAALTYVPQVRETCASSGKCEKTDFCAICPCWEFNGETLPEVLGYDEC